MDAPRLLLVADDDVETRIRAAVPELNGNLQRWSGAPDELEASGIYGLMAASPDVVAFGPQLATATALDLAGQLDRFFPEVVTLLLANPSPRLWEKAARVGIRDVVSSTADDETLREAVKRTFATVESRRLPRPPAPITADGDRRAVIVVRSPKGGSGKTMVATNVAVLLAKTHPGDVVLVDLDLQFGDVSSALGVEPHYTIADATANADLTPTSLKASLSKHASNLYALCAPPRPDDAAVITGDDVAAVLELLRSAFQYVVVDTAAGSDSRMTAAVEMATDIVLLCSMDVSSVRALAKDVVGRAAQQARTTNHLVLNRGDSRVALEVRDIEATVGQSVDVQLPSSRLVPLHMNCGVPVVDAEPGALITKQLHTLAERLAPVPANTSTRKGWRKRR